MKSFLQFFFAAHGIFLFSRCTAHAADCVPGSWVKLAPLPRVRQEHGTVSLENRTIAVIGGITYGLPTLIETTNHLDLYDIASNTWHSGTPSPIKVNHPNVVAIGHKIYLLGGLTVGPLLPWSPINWIGTGSSHVYDSRTDQWSELESMPAGTERGSTVTVAHDEMIYLAGGITQLQAFKQDSLTMVTAFNTTSGRWQTLPEAAANIPEGRQHAIGAVIGSSMYVVGGRWFSVENVRGTVFQLDLQDMGNGWSTLAKQMPVPRGGLSGGAVGNKVYAFGGEGNNATDTGVYNETESIDIGTKEWSELTPMEFPRHGSYAAVAGTRVYLPGGCPQQQNKIFVDGRLSIGLPTAYFDAYCV